MVNARDLIVARYTRRNSTQPRGRVMMRSIVVGAAVVAALSLVPAREAAAQNGQWSWGTCGATQGWSDQDREHALVDQGMADPCVNYWTPFYARIDGANV